VSRNEPAEIAGWYRGRGNGVLAGEIRTFNVVMGPAGCEGRQGRGLDWRPQFHRAAESGGDEERRPRLLLSYSNEGKEIVGIAEVVKEAYPDPTDKTGKFVCVDIKADKPLKTPVTMAAIKADKKFADMALVKYSRLSVQAVTADEWKMVCKMGGL